MGVPPRLATAEDPVCKMQVPKVNPPGGSVKHGETFYFCSAACRAKFAADPHKYMGEHHHH